MGEGGWLIDERYVLRQPIRSVGAASVWEAWDEVLSRPVSVVVPTRGAPPSEVSHPHMVAVYDWGEASDPGGTVAAYVVTEPLDVPTLAVRIADRRLRPSEAVRACAHVAGAMARLHLAGYVHGAPNPDAVFLTPDGARLLCTEAVPATAEGRAEDVRLIGRLLAAALTGETTGAPRLPGNTPDAVAAVYLRCVEPDPEARPSATKIAEDLAGLVLTPVAIAPADTTPRPFLGTLLALGSPRSPRALPPPTPDPAYDGPEREDGLAYGVGATSSQGSAADGSEAADEPAGGHGPASVRGVTRSYRSSPSPGATLIYEAAPGHRAPTASAWSRRAQTRAGRAVLVLAGTAGAIGLVTAVALALGSALPGSLGPPPTAVAVVPPPVTSSAAAPVSPDPSVVPSVVPSGTPGSSAPAATPTPSLMKQTLPPPQVALARFRTAVANGLAAGQIRQDVALDFDNVARNLLQGRAGDPRTGLDVLSAKVRTRLRENGLTPALAQTLLAILTPS